MLKDLLKRHRTLRIGASLVGASVLAVGFASPAFATENPTGPTGGNSPSANYNIFEGGSNTTYLMMTALSNVFNEAPGCDLAAASGQTQPLDYGCAGDTGEPGSSPNETSLSINGTTPVTGSTLLGSKKITIGTSVPTGIAVGQPFTDSAVAFPGGATITAITAPVSPATNYVLSASVAAVSTNASDTLTVVTTPAVGENGFVPFGQENPFNDILIQEPAIGSSNGIAELQQQGAYALGAWNQSAGTGNNVSPLDAARSSRAPKLSSSGDREGQNFVAYAMDGVSWFHWSKVGTTATPSAAVSSLTVAQLQSIYEGTLTCTNPTTGLAAPMDWGCVGGTFGKPIVTYMAQNGSGTESTWATMLALPSTGFPFGGEDTHHVIFENETESIIANGDEKNAIFFFSYGKYTTTCTPASGYCGSAPAGWAGGTIALGAIQNGSGPSLPVNKCTILLQLPGETTCTKGTTTYTTAAGDVFAGDRLLYNIYADGADANVGTSSLATLNALSEDGFMCKPSTATDVDPNSGSTYRTEINAIIKAQGFSPLPLEVEDGNGSSTSPYSTTASGITHPAWTTGGLGTSKYLNTTEESAPYNFPAADTDTDNSAISGSYTVASGSVTATPTNPVGYCLTLTTDSDGHA